ncbi:MAG: RNA methyltransferase [Pseudomonadota bacterium]
MKRPPRNRQDRRASSSGERPRTLRADAPEGPLWLWGSHAVTAALANPARTILRLIATENAARRLALPDPEIVSAKTIDNALPPGAVHQGVAAHVQPLTPLPLGDGLDTAPGAIAVLDQVSDPHNLGAIMRSAAAFGIGALILQTRHTPPITGTVAKSAAGAVEQVPEIRVVNIARSLEALQTAGYTVIGLAGGGSARLDTALDGAGKVALVLGAEGAGLRPAVAKACDLMAHIPISAAMESLNVSNAAAIAFHEIARARKSGPFSPE